MGVTYNYGAGPTYTKIASQTLGSAAASVTFSNLPQNYTDLVLVLNSASASVDAFTYLQFNSDTATNYSHTFLYGNATNVFSVRTSNTSTMLNVDVNMETTSIIYNAIYQIQNYSNSTTFKTTLVRQNNTGSDYPGALAGVGLWRNTSPITTIKIQATRGGSAYNFVSGSTFTLYGVAAALKPKATGGDITTDGTYFIHTFRTSGVFQPKQNLTVDYLVVAGGGGGGSLGGGGGAGGLRSTVTATGGGGSLESALSLTSGTGYTVTVGAGGAGAAANGSAGTAGNNSVFSTITSTAGGAGAGDGNAATSGGSGGGGGNSPTGGGAAGTANQGYAGGGYGGGGGSGSGGGGAGAVGSPGAVMVNSTAIGGNGGNGVAVSITGSSVTYAGGGGGGGRKDTVGGNAAGGTGGTGGGGTGGSSDNTTPSSAGGTNLGGGGGGGAYYSAGYRAGSAGGSGIVIVRYSA